jgi:hypothetical protein
VSRRHPRTIGIAILRIAMPLLLLSGCATVAPKAAKPADDASAYSCGMAPAGTRILKIAPVR